jgi:hypothetical protein
MEGFYAGDLAETSQEPVCASSLFQECGRTFIMQFVLVLVANLLRVQPGAGGTRSELQNSAFTVLMSFVSAQSSGRHPCRRGQLVATPAALAAVEQSDDNLASFIRRPRAGDWGDLCADDIRENEFSLESPLGLSLERQYEKSG